MVLDRDQKLNKTPQKRTEMQHAYAPMKIN